ncbi:hypothetical protein dsx2_3110 [Desulfovibrio sp. X2]|uniref:hypothetical protein n=1 Tax=Desulfovibrio sp. X2 TaxID=941449 RepID=UPI00035893E2|nr:hypothetical protein [Desulfovibrio sp. X2]EPR41591.1 hypothetical protein dsx2_3110 [Desulfovibrio sp. X2]
MKRWLDWISRALFVVFLLSVLDIALYLVFDSGEPFRIVSGREMPIVGSLSDKEAALLPAVTEQSERDVKLAAERAQRLLLFTADNDFLGLRLADVRGRMWRGTLFATREATDGQYSFTVVPRDMPPPSSQASAEQRAEQHTVRIFESERALRDSYASFCVRYLGAEPWWTTGATMIATAVMLGLAFIRGGKEARNLQARGLGPIYKLALGQGAGEWELLFGLGAEHGVTEGATLAVLDSDGHWLGEFRAYGVSADASRGRLDKTVPVTHDCLIARMWAEEKRRA